MTRKLRLFCSGMLIVAIAVSGISGCGKSSSKTGTKSVSPSKTEAHPDERDIYRITLTPEAEQRLGIVTVPAKTEAVSRQRIVGGELMLPDGAAVIVTAPVAGTVRLPDEESHPRAGTQLATDSIVISIDPLLSPERDVLTPAERVQIAVAEVNLISAKVVAQGDMKTAAAELEAAEIALRRAESLLASQAGSARAVDDAKARVALAEEALAAAEFRVEAIKNISLPNVSGPKLTPTEPSLQKLAEPIEIKVPHAGVLRNVAVDAGQYVTAGSPLFEVVNLDTLWVRVPVYVGLLSQITPDINVQVRKLSQSTAADTIPATPVNAPPSADPIAATADMYFAIDNSEHNLRPGERVSVILPLNEEEQRLVLPRNAILRDIQGVTWVYVRSGELQYKRERVLVDFTTDKLAVLKYGPAVGTEVVTDGTAELFGTEFGAKK